MLTCCCYSLEVPYIIRYSYIYIDISGIKVIGKRSVQDSCTYGQIRVGSQIIFIIKINK
jgi:hypothetical protein